MPDPRPQDIDVVKLNELLKDTEQHPQIGRRVLRAVMMDVLRSKLGGTASFWIERLHGSQSSVAAVLHELIDNVPLTEEERRILNELEKEEEDDHRASGG